MEQFKRGLGDGLGERLFWDFSFKNRKFLMPVLIGSILILGFLLIQKFISQEMTIKKLSEFEPVYVLGVKRDFSIGEIIRGEDLEAITYSKKEFDKNQYYESNQIKELVGRIIKTPIFASTPLREEYLAPKGSMPGLQNLIPENYSLVDVEVPQTGFNIYLRPGDKVDLVENINSSTRLLLKEAQIVLIDSQTLEKAPFVVENNSSKKRNLTLIAPINFISEIAKARKNQNLFITISNNREHVFDSNKIQNNNYSSKLVPIKAKEHFQSLVFIHGKDKEVYGQ